MLLYQEIKNYIHHLIDTQGGALKLPSERQLLERFKSTRITVREVLTRLETEGLIYRQNRKGWFVSPTKLRWNPVRKVNYYQLAQEQGFTPKTQLLDISSVVVNDEISSAFSLPNHTECWQINRVRSLDARPVMLEVIYCPIQSFPGLSSKSLEGSITTLFEQDYDVEVMSEQSTINMTALSEDKADLLNLTPGAPCLKIVRKRFCGLGNLVDFNIEYWVHGAIEIEVESH